MDASKFKLNAAVTLGCFWTTIGGLFMLFALVGCSGTYGRLVHDEAVDQVFEGLTVLPGYRYYYSGSDDKPSAIIAIDERFILSTRLWKSVEMTDAQLKKWMGFRAIRARHRPITFGRYILDDKGQEIGLWYSFGDWQAFAMVKMLDDKRVEISPPSDRELRPRSRFDDDNER